MKISHLLYAGFLIFTSAYTQEAGLVLRGQLLDENGLAPLANQNVYSDNAGTLVAKTDAMGYFDYPVKEGQTKIHVLPWSKEIVGRSVIIDVEDFRNSVFKIVVERGVTLQVKVTAKDGTPIHDAKVTWMGSGGAHAKSNEKGIAFLGRISRFKNGHVQVTMPGCRPAVSKPMLNASVYTDRVITIVVPDYGEEKAPEEPIQKQENIPDLQEATA